MSHDAPAKSSPPCAGTAFSLVELLVVVAVIALIATFSIPAFQSIGQSRGVGDAAASVAAAVELARTEAVARQTFVWLGLQNTNKSGSQDLQVGIVYSKDGSSTNTATNNLQPVVRAQLIQRAGLVDASTLDVGTAVSETSLHANTAGVSFDVGPAKFTGTSITFTPDGEAMLVKSPAATDGFDPAIAIGLRAFRGTAAMTNHDVVVLVDGSVGVPQILEK